jgi:hypothetical protein
MFFLHVDVVLFAAKEEQINEKVESYDVKLVKFVHFGYKKTKKQEL